MTSTGSATWGTTSTRCAASPAATSCGPASSLPPLLLEDEEAVAIAVGLRTAAASAVDGAEHSLQALTKVVGLMPPRLRRRMDALQSATVAAPSYGPSVDAMTLTTIAQGCRDDETLRFGYTAREGEATQAARRAAPAGVARAAVVPRRLRPRPAGLAVLPRRPDGHPRAHRHPLPRPRAARRRRARLRAGRHQVDAAGLRRPRPLRRARRGRGAGVRPLVDRTARPRRPRRRRTCG